MTSKQLDFIRRLMAERQMDDDDRARLQALLDSGEVPWKQASSIIDWLKARPYQEGAQPQGTGIDISDLPSGRYAVGDVLIKIDNLTDADGGKWAGWVFVKNASEYTADERFGSQRPANTYYGKHADLLAAVLDDPTAAMQHYGRITGSCAVCGRKLEDEVSVERGLGPVCIGRVA